jgi:hypothetical protein
MHLPPLDVAIYPVTTMSRGTHPERRIRSSSASTSSSSSSSTSSRISTASPDYPSIQKVIRSVFRSSRIIVRQAERLQGRLHQVYFTKLADGNLLVIKCPPAHTVRLLRHEKHLLETERTALETLHEYTQIPVPQIIKYDGHGGALGSPYLMMSYIPGRRLSDMVTSLTTNERRKIDRALGTYVRALTALSATQFGMTHRVFAQKGCNTWREAFLVLLEGILRDAEDMLITIPYDSIRYYFGKNSHFLDEVTQPRLVAMHVCDPQNVLISEQTHQVTGLVGFSHVLWGDPLLSGGIADGSDAFFEGLEDCPIRTGSVKARLSMYVSRFLLVKCILLTAV